MIAADSVDATVFAAFGVGFMSFASPCVLPLVPGYLSTISGVSFADLQEGRGRTKVLGPALLFCLALPLPVCAQNPAQGAASAADIDYLLARANGQPLAAQMYLVGADRLTYYHGASTRNRELTPKHGPTAIFWHAMRLAAKRVPDAVERWLRMYEAEREEGEAFNAWSGSRAPRSTSRWRRRRFSSRTGS